MHLTDDDLRLLKELTLRTRREPDQFARGASWIQKRYSIPAQRRRLRTELHSMRMQIRRDGRRPIDNNGYLATFSAKVDLRPANFERKDSDLTVVHAAQMDLELSNAGRLMNRSQAEAVVLVAVKRFDDNPEPNPSFPQCLKRPPRLELDADGDFQRDVVNEILRRNFPTEFMPLVRWACNRIESWGQVPNQEVQEVNAGLNVVLSAEGPLEVALEVENESSERRIRLSITLRKGIRPLATVRIVGRTQVMLARYVIEHPDQDHTWLNLLRHGLQKQWWRNTSPANLERTGRRVRDALGPALRGYWAQSGTEVRWQRP